MTAFDIVDDQQSPRGSRRSTDDNLGVDRFGSLGRRLARRGGCEEFLSCDEPMDPPDERRRIGQRLKDRIRDRFGGDSTERPLLGKIKDILKQVGEHAPEKLKPFIDFITKIVDIKHERKNGKFHFDIEREGASTIPLELSQGPFKLASVGLAKNLSFDFSLKDGLTDIKGLTVNGELAGFKKSIPVKAATVIMESGKPFLQVDIGLGTPIKIPLSQVMDKK